jgi:hypothetical protein
MTLLIRGTIYEKSLITIDDHPACLSITSPQNARKYHQLIMEFRDVPTTCLIEWTISE